MVTRINLRIDGLIDGSIYIYCYKDRRIKRKIYIWIDRQILSRVRVYRRGFGLKIGFIDHFNTGLVTTID
jgi:hypothetical protein